MLLPARRRGRRPALSRDHSGKLFRLDGIHYCVEANITIMGFPLGGISVISGEADPAMVHKTPYLTTARQGGSGGLIAAPMLRPNSDPG